MPRPHSSVQCPPGRRGQRCTRGVGQALWDLLCRHQTAATVPKGRGRCLDAEDERPPSDWPGPLQLWWRPTSQALNHSAYLSAVPVGVLFSAATIGSWRPGASIRHCGARSTAVNQAYQLRAIGPGSVLRVPGECVCPHRNFRRASSIRTGSRRLSSSLFGSGLDHLPPQLASRCGRTPSSVRRRAA